VNRFCSYDDVFEHLTLQRYSVQMRHTNTSRILGHSPGDLWMFIFFKVIPIFRLMCIHIKTLLRIIIDVGCYILSYYA